MTATTLLGAAASAAGVLIGLSPCLQVRRMRRRRSAADVSLGAVAAVELGAIIWLAYAVAIGSAPLLITNAVSVVTGGTCGALALRLRR